VRWAPGLGPAPRTCRPYRFEVVHVSSFAQKVLQREEHVGQVSRRSLDPVPPAADRVFEFCGNAAGIEIGDHGGGGKKKKKQKPARALCLGAAARKSLQGSAVKAIQPEIRRAVLQHELEDDRRYPGTPADRRGLKTSPCAVL